MAISRKQASKISQARSSNTNQAHRHQCTPRKDPSRMYTRTRGRVEELLVAEELWNDHKKPFFFPFPSAATCTNHSLEVDQRSEQGEALAPRPAEEQEDEEPTSPSPKEEGDDYCVAIKKAPLPTSRSHESIATAILSHYQVVSPPSEHQEATTLVAITTCSSWHPTRAADSGLSRKF
ncbi:hypothetical protein Taro_005807, partial [Colocasia esculenta]|nr:hypothetical protein [Colocasia esculenta]